MIITGSNSNAVTGLEPRRVMLNFAAICSVPHGSKNEAGLREAILNEAKVLDYPTFVDKAGNLLVKMAATTGFENRPSVCLQAHLDMVCEKRDAVEHHFLTDPIIIIRDGEWLRADSTSLGADNGFGGAACLALLENPVAHGPLEFLFTVEEETGLVGASKLRLPIESKIMINLDSETHGQIFTSCAGGARILGTWKPRWVKASKRKIAVKIRIWDCTGGHSGVDIHLGRLNPIKAITTVLRHVNWCQVSSVTGGTKMNAIPREAEAIVFVKKSELGELKEAVGKILTSFWVEHAKTDPDMKFSVEKIPNVWNRRILRKSWRTVIVRGLDMVLNGVSEMHPEIDGLVATSQNLGVVRTKKGRITAQLMPRSCFNDRLDLLITQMTEDLRNMDAKVRVSSKYPGWNPDPNSAVLQTARNVFLETYGSEATVMNIHAGLECGHIVTIYPGMDVISIGPTIESPHSPAERVNIASVQEFWKFLLALLKKIQENDNALEAQLPGGDVSH